ncbi:50S ribosomal protein L3 [Candidatus Micrarchaeota archaeon]|nr:50S ribosomal protein L3 [Candidatus Micrarchaeota archaeon]
MDIRKPKKGSRAFRPRKRAASQVPRVFWPPVEEKRILGFAGYKVGMTQISFVDDTNSPSKGQEVITAATVIEVPPMFVYGIRAYMSKNKSCDFLVDDDKVIKVLKIKKKKAQKEIDSASAEDIRLLVYALPGKTTIGKKHIEKMEIAVGGKDSSEKLEFAKSLLGKELKASEVFKAGEYVDIIAVTKGKGWQGPVKRFGVSLQRRKATGKKRHVGTLGPFHPGYLMYTAPQAGQTGYHKRTELNKRIFSIDENLDAINPSSGFPQYGFVKNQYILVKGSIPGPSKRMVRLRVSTRGKEVKEPVLKNVFTE